MGDSVLTDLLLVPLEDTVVFPGMNVTLTVDVGEEDRVLLVPRHESEYAAVGTIAEVSDRVLDLLAERVAENYDVVVDRAIGLGDRVVVSMRFSRIELDPSDERPLQSRRSYLLGRWAAVVHTRDGRVVRVEEHPHLEAALEAAGLEAE